MVALALILSLWLQCTAGDYYDYQSNVTRSSLSGIAAYRSALTLDWLANEDDRQRELVAAFETEDSVSTGILSSDCVAYARPASGKVARLLLELLKNLEGDDGYVISELIHGLLYSKLLVETAMFDSEPDLEALVEYSDVMRGEPHTTFPRILGMVWIAATDPQASKNSGWCSINRVNKYIKASRPSQIAKHMRTVDPIIARARFIMEAFIRHVAPINVYDNKNIGRAKKAKPTKSTSTRKVPQAIPSQITFMKSPPTRPYAIPSRSRITFMKSPPTRPYAIHSQITFKKSTSTRPYVIITFTNRPAMPPYVRNNFIMSGFSRN